MPTVYYGDEFGWRGVLIGDLGEGTDGVVLPFPGGGVVAGHAELRPDGGGTAILVSPHEYALVSSAG